MKNKLKLRKVFENNTFVFVFSVICAVLIWFYMSMNNDLGKPKYVYDVPITINLSETAQSEGVQVFNQNINTARVSISGNNIIINQVTAEDLEIIATVSPLVSKLSGQTVIKDTINLTAYKKGNDLADYQVIDVLPSNIEVIYDRYKEKTFDITSQLEYIAGDNFYVSTPVLSDTNVVLSGPESSINQVASVAIKYTAPSAITQTQTVEAPIVLYDINNNKLDPADLYIKTNIDFVAVNFEVMSKQTVELDCTILNLPNGFSEERVTITPATIDIAGNKDIVSTYKTITLSGAVDFSSVNTKNSSFTMDIPMPEQVTNISNITTANVTVNLNGYSQSIIPTSQIQFSNVPDNKEVTLVTQSVDATVVGTTAVVNKLTKDSVYGTIDMAGLAETNGSKEVSVKVSILDQNSCWVYGKYTAYVEVKDKVVSANTNADSE